MTDDREARQKPEFGLWWPATRNGQHVWVLLLFLGGAWGGLRLFLMDQLTPDRGEPLIVPIGMLLGMVLTYPWLVVLRYLGNWAAEHFGRRED